METGETIKDRNTFEQIMVKNDLLPRIYSPK